jgi:crcB protein
MTELSLLAIGIGGGLGSIARFVVSREMGNWLGNYLPYGTLTVNIAGSLALGWVITFFFDRPELSSTLRLGLTVGFLGAFTTFSTFSFESLQLLLDGSVWRAFFNVVLNAAACIVMCYLGMQMARMM